MDVILGMVMLWILFNIDALKASLPVKIFYLASALIIYSNLINEV